MKYRSIFILLLVLIAGCSPEPAPSPTLSPIPPSQTSTVLPPTITPTLTSTATSTFTPTASPPPPTATFTPSLTLLPGLLVFPVDTLGNTIPWLPFDDTARPGVHFVAFNTSLPPFNSALVRRAFAYAIDRVTITEMAANYKASSPKPATSLTPPETLGRDLYNRVGIPFDPAKAKEVLAEAGYTDPSSFPTITIIVNSYGDIAPGARFNMAKAMAEMWKTHLGVTVEVQALVPPNFGNRLRSNPPEIFWLGWVPEVNDPDDFLRLIFHSESQSNYGKFSSPEFDQLVDRAARSHNPAERQELYILAERLLCETEAALIPLYHVKYDLP
jgi:ABC-type oligopeptide transport system substrate-binding subunit